MRIPSPGFAKTVYTPLSPVALRLVYLPSRASAFCCDSLANFRPLHSHKKHGLIRPIFFRPKRVSFFPPPTQPQTGPPCPAQKSQNITSQLPLPTAESCFVRTHTIPHLCSHICTFRPPGKPRRHPLYSHMLALASSFASYWRQLFCMASS